MAIRYFYIDDDALTIIEETAKGLSIRPNDLIVKAHQHKKWAEQLPFIIEHQKEIDGILFDWGLTQKNENGDEADFSVEALAQQIRRNSIGDDRKIKTDFPLVLCSANDNFKEIFPKELTGHDLFDAVYEKLDFDEPNAVINELTNLANGYKEITKCKSALELLDIANEDDTDYRIIDRLDAFIRENSPTHEIARFILTKIINVTGVLIDEDLLASRLGIDVIYEYDDSWEKLIDNQLSECLYSGVFSDSHYQFWSNKIDDWIEEQGLGNKSPKDKVVELNKRYGLNLSPATKTDKSKSDDFWVVCKKTGVPIALEDAVIALSKDKELSKVPWQDDEYFSIDTALETDINLIHPSEKERVQKLKNLYTKKRPKRT